MVHHHQAVTDRRFFTRRTIWHWRSIAPLRSQAPGEPARPLSTLAAMAQAQGVNVVGFFRAEFGQGEAARRVVDAVRKAGLPFSTITYDRVPHRQEHPFEVDGEARYPTNILCLNAEHLLQFVQDGGSAVLRRRSSAGLWFWEGSRLPRELRPALDLVDEIWVASDFVGQALAAETSKPM